MIGGTRFVVIGVAIGVALASPAAGGPHGGAAPKPHDPAVQSPASNLCVFDDPSTHARRGCTLTRRLPLNAPCTCRAGTKTYHGSIAAR